MTAEQRIAAIKSVDAQKQTIQTLARALVDTHLRAKKSKPGEKARLYANLLGEDAPIYHKATPLEGQLRNSKNERLRRIVSDIQRAREKLHYTMDVKFPRLRPPNRDLLWAFLSFLFAPFLALPFLWISPLFGVAAILTPFFFLARKIWRFFTDLPPRDFSLNAHGVTREEYQDIAGSTENDAGLDASYGKTHAKGLDASDRRSHFSGREGKGLGTKKRPGFFDDGTSSHNGGGKEEEDDEAYTPL